MYGDLKEYWGAIRIKDQTQNSPEDDLNKVEQTESRKTSG